MLHQDDNQKSVPRPLPPLEISHALRLIEALTGSPDTEVTIKAFPEPDDGREGWIFHGSLGKKWTEIESLNLDGFCLALQVNEGDLQGSKGKNVTAVRALFVDDDSGTLTPSALNLTPTVTVQSVHGIHAYWKLKPGERLEDFKAAQWALAKALGTDTSVSDLSRGMRLAGTLHLKDMNHPTLVTVLQSDPSLSYTIEEVLREHGCRLPPAVTTPGNGASTTATPLTVNLDQSITRGRAYLEKIPGSPEGGRNAVAFRAAAVLTHDLAVPVDDAMPILKEWNQRNEPPLTPEELERIAANASRYGQSPTGSKLAPTSDPPPPVVTPTQLPPVLVSKRLTIGRIKSPLTEQFILGSFIPFGKSSVLYGPQSVGKSAWMAQLAFAFAAGAEQLWGLRLYPGGGPVLIYTAEDTFEDWERKGAAILKGSGINVEKALERLFVIDKTEGVARLSEVITIRNATTSRRVAQPTEEAEALVAAAKQIGAMLVLNETASRLVEDEDNANMSALQSALGRGARLTGAAWLTTHHPTKVASKENDASPESARGGGAFVNNSRNGLSLFPADSNEAKKWEDRFLADDLVVLGHAKPTSSTRRQPPITLVRCDAVYGAVFRLPDEVAYTPEEAQRNTIRLDQQREAKWEQLGRLYDVVARALKLGDVSPTKLRDDHIDEIDVPRRKLRALLVEAVEKKVLTKLPAKGRGERLGLGLDPRKPINESAPDVY